MLRVKLYKSSLVNTLEGLQDKDPERIIVEEDGMSYTASGLYLHAVSIAKGMAALGVNKEATIVVAMPPGFLFVSYLLAGTMNGARMVLLDPEMGRENYQSKLRQLQPGFAIIDKRLLFLQEHPFIRFMTRFLKGVIPYFPHRRGISYLTDNRSLPVFKKHFSAKKIQQGALEIEADWQTADEGQDAFIVYTSGTIAEPKGVLHSIGSFNASIQELSRCLDMRGLRIGVALPHFVFLAIASQGTAVIMSRFSSQEKKYQFLADRRIEVLFGPPSEFARLVQYCNKNGKVLPSTIRQLLLGSAPVHPPFLRKLIACTHPLTGIQCVYGMTEHLLVAMTDGRVKAAGDSDHDMLGTFVGHVGFRISDDGELLIQGPQLFKRYYHLSSGEAYHATGDLVKMEGDILYLTGRKKNMIIRGDFNIYPELYEHTIMKIEGVDEALMIGIYDEDIHDEKLYLLIDGNIDKARLMRLLMSGPFSIDREALPDEIIMTPIPHSGRQSKADRKEARQMVMDKKNEDNR